MPIPSAKVVASAIKLLLCFIVSTPELKQMSLFKSRFRSSANLLTVVPPKGSGGRRLNGKIATTVWDSKSPSAQGDEAPG